MPERDQLQFVKWAPNLLEHGMKNLRDLHPEDTPASDPGSHFWIRTAVNDNVAALGGSRVVTGEWQIQSIIDHRILQPLCSIASRILFHLDADPPKPGSGRKYHDLETQAYDSGPPLWETVVGLFTRETPAAARGILPDLVERIIFALELKSLNIAQSAFSYQLCCLAAANTLGPPKEIAYRRCKQGVNCPHSKKQHVRRSKADGPAFLDALKQSPIFNPNQDELIQLVTDVRALNADQADNSGAIHPQNSDSQAIFAKHPHAHVALAILRTGARFCTEDSDDIVEAEKQTQAEGSEFEEHYRCVLHQVNLRCSSALISLISSAGIQVWSAMVHRDLNFAAISNLKEAVMVYRSPSEQTLYVSTPLLPGATNPTFTQALLSQIIVAYQERLARNSSTETPYQWHNGSATDCKRGDDRTVTRNRSGPASGGKRKIREYESRPSKKPRQGDFSNSNIPIATFGSTDRLNLSKVGILLPYGGFRI
jgi:hypothetical protein